MTEPMKVLVVDDNRAAATSLSLLVELIGHEVRTAFDGEEALVVASAFFTRKSCFWTWACPGWMAMRLAATCANSPGARTLQWLR